MIKATLFTFAAVALATVGVACAVTVAIATHDPVEIDLGDEDLTD